MTAHFNGARYMSCIEIKDFYYVNSGVVANELSELGYLSVSVECDNQLFSVARSTDLQPSAR